MNLKDRPTLQKVLATLLASVAALVGILLLGGDEEKDQQAVARVCDALALLANPDIEETCDLFTHGPDPKRAFDAVARPTTGVSAGVPSNSVNLYYRQSRLCPGDGRSGQRVYLHVGAPADKPAPTSSFISLVKQTIGLAERQMRISHPTHAQKINFYCATDSTPTIKRESFPEIGSDGEFDFDDMLVATGEDTRAGTHVAFVANIDAEYPYCGEATVGGFGDDDVHYALISPSCLAPNDTFLHELGHNLGAVSPDAPNDSGAYHCHERADVMCYNDGGSYFRQGGQMTSICPPFSFDAPDGKTYSLGIFDCQHDDYFNPTRDFSWRNTSDSLLLTRPRRK